MVKKIADFFEEMIELFPSTQKAYFESVSEYGEVLETVVLEDVFMPVLLRLLSENKETKLLKKFFDYLEEILNSEDEHLISVISITILEILGNDREILDISKQYMGVRTTELQIMADKELGRL